jgi:hypothetical protein
VGQLDLPQIDRHLGVEQDAAAAQDEQIERLQRRQDVVAQELPHRHRVLHRVTAPGVGRVSREDRDLDRDRAPQLSDVMPSRIASSPRFQPP